MFKKASHPHIIAKRAYESPYLKQEGLEPLNIICASTKTEGNTEDYEYDEDDEITEGDWSIPIWDK